MTTTRCIPHRICLTVRGTVQGVGFRPFVYQLATELGLAGGVKNTAQGAVIEIEGSEPTLRLFVQRLQAELPPPGAIQTLTPQSLPVQGLEHFQIWPSDWAEDAATATILPDLSTCSDCWQDIFDPHNRRYRYPFTNCGPRFSIIIALPYDFSREANFWQRPGDRPLTHGPATTPPWLLGCLDGHRQRSGKLPSR